MLRRKCPDDYVILYLDASVRPDSRTGTLAEYLLSKLSGTVTRLPIYGCAIPRLDYQRLEWRNKCCEERNFDDEYFSLAKQFVAADTIVISAPCWDYSFPACLKAFVEAISVNGLTFCYSDEGTPKGLCAAKELYYVTTVGGYLESYEYGFGYIRSISQKMFGVKEAYCFKAEGLDIAGADIENILQNTRNEIDAHFA